ncbi:flagellar biosynthetic protein FliO [Variovorax sp. RB2P76]|uniref:flagellar biosynthetic protein FliO n=1 Tax=Variovorax sp. RB2P76 TaxID=3443736 RepID=UPI003F492BD9
MPLLMMFLLVLAVCAWPRVAASAEVVPPQAAAQEGVTASTSIPLALPVRRDDSPAWQTGGVGVFGALSMVMLVLALVVWWLRRSGWAQVAGNAGEPVAGGGWRRLMAARATAQLRVIESARLTPRSSVHVVQWHGREWLLGCTEQGITVIGQQPAPAASSLAAAHDEAGSTTA